MRYSTHIYHRGYLNFLRTTTTQNLQFIYFFFARRNTESTFVQETNGYIINY